MTDNRYDSERKFIKQVFTRYRKKLQECSIIFANEASKSFLPQTKEFKEITSGLLTMIDDLNGLVETLFNRIIDNEKTLDALTNMIRRVSNQSTNKDELKKVVNEELDMIKKNMQKRLKQSLEDMKKDHKEFGMYG